MPFIAAVRPLCTTISCRPRGIWRACLRDAGLDEIEIEDGADHFLARAVRPASAPCHFPLPAMSDSSAAGVRPVARFLTVSLARELGILLCLSVMFPFMIHIIPVPGTRNWGRGCCRCSMPRCWRRFGDARGRRWCSRWRRRGSTGR